MSNQTPLSPIAESAAATTDFRNPEGFHVFYENTAGSLAQFLRRRCNGNEDEALELVQETFIQAWLGREKFQGRSSASTWVFGIAINLWRKKCRQRKFAALNDEIEVASSAQSPDNELSDRELALLIAQSVANLPADWREVFRLVRQEGLSYSQAAEQLHVTENTVRMRLHRATLQLAQELEEYRHYFR